MPSTPGGDRTGGGGNRPGPQPSPRPPPSHERGEPLTGIPDPGYKIERIDPIYTIPSPPPRSPSAPPDTEQD